MGGYSANKSRKVSLGQPAAARAQDACDLELRIDLVGVRSEVSAVLIADEPLHVALLSQGSIRSVVCRKDEAVVGTLAAFRGLAQLITCLDQGHDYVAWVEDASPTRCAVLVQRVS